MRSNGARARPVAPSAPTRFCFHGSTPRSRHDGTFQYGAHRPPRSAECGVRSAESQSAPQSAIRNPQCGGPWSTVLMQRLLRGRLLYLLLGLLLVLLYWWSVRSKLFQAFEPAPAAPLSGQLHEEFEMAALVERMRQEPALGFALSTLTLFIAGMALGGVALTLHGLWTGRAMKS